MSGDNPTPRDGHAAGSHYQPPLPVLLLIVLLFVGGTVLMVRSVSPTSSATTTTTSPSTTSTTTPSSTRVIKSRVRVQVANGTNSTNLAGRYTQQLQTQDWDTLPPTNGPATAKTLIYFKAGQVPAAREIASTLHVKSSAIHPLGNLSSVAGAQGDDIVVILGNDLVPK